MKWLPGEVNAKCGGSYSFPFTSGPLPPVTVYSPDAFTDILADHLQSRTVARARGGAAELDGPSPPDTRCDRLADNNSD